ncbi:sodium-dependent glucose transporter 1A-like [Argopecten irradians]|uniref:sodium-dependent glucose transporter 1A-like n=1 Tax=Argopecten irradians TaxID=31199 RepID=UPI00371E4C11
MATERNSPRNGSRKSNTRRHQILYSISIYSTFLMIGWNRALIGPSFPDIQQICQIDLEFGSWIFTSLFIGYGFGSLAAGLSEKIDRKLTFGSSLAVLTVAVTVTPWCSIYWIMIVIHIVQGFFQGIVDTIGNSEILLIWKDSRLLFFCLELSFSIGGFVAPLIAAPFLMDIPPPHTTTTNVTINDNETMSHINSLDTSAFKHEPFNRSFNIINKTVVISPLNFQSKIYIPYTLTAFLMGCISISFLILFYIYKQDQFTDSNKEIVIRDSEDEFKSLDLSKGPEKTKEVANIPGRNRRDLPVRIKGLSLAIISAFLLFYTGVEETFVSYLTIFSVDYLKWSPSDGALITGVTNICGLVAIVVSLFMNCVNTIVYAGINCVLVFLTFVGLLISSEYQQEQGIWISCSVHGVFRAMLFSLIFAWTNEYIISVTGRISSIFMISACIGASVNPVLLGNLVERFGEIWLCYGFVVEGFIVLSLYFVIVGITRYVVKNFGKNIDKSNSYETTISIKEFFIKENEDTL